LSGGDTIQACRKYKSPFAFMPQCKLVMSANHRPPIPDQTESIWDRLRILTFPNQFVRGVNRDEELPEKLKAEWNGILRWMQEGAAMWSKGGVGTAPSVELEVKQERKDQDPLGGFFDGVVKALPDTFCSCADIHREFDRWARAEGWNDPWKQPTLTRRLKQRGFRYENKAGIGRGFNGIAIMEGNEPRACDKLNQPTTQMSLADRAAPAPTPEPEPEPDREPDMEPDASYPY
jgi:putative DNA primase/helicase